MNRSAVVLAAALVALSAPAAVASWYAGGTMEPDTDHDVSSPYVWNDTPRDPNARAVYFNVISTQYPVDANPNVGALDTHVTPAIVHSRALLGVWLDCNLDNYIGFGETAVEAYSAALLPADSPCVADGADPEAFNDGNWVYEFFHLGNRTVNSTNWAPNLLQADGILVWQDVGLPGAEPGYSCPLSPPAGSTASTGGMLRWADCSGSGTFASTVNAVDSDCSLNLCFPDYENPQESDSLLNVRFPVHPYNNTYTEENDGLLENNQENMAFTTWDCSRPITVTDDTRLTHIFVEDPEGGDNHTQVNLTDEEYKLFIAPTPAPGVNNPTGSYGGALNATERGAIHHCEEEASTEAEFVVEATRVEGELESSGQSGYGKNEVGAWFTFNDGRSMKQSQVIAANNNITYGEVVASVTGERTNGVLGLRLTTVFDSAGWSSRTIITSEEYYITPESGATDARYFSFYAFVPPEAQALHRLTMPAGTSTAPYGLENCGGNIGAADGIVVKSNQHKGWACDPDAWYLRPAGTPYDSGPDIRVGQPYNLRDIDCYNGIGLCQLADENPN